MPEIKGETRFMVSRGSYLWSLGLQNTVAGNNAAHFLVTRKRVGEEQPPVT